jgi:hypothetical protein
VGEAQVAAVTTSLGSSHSESWKPTATTTVTTTMRGGEGALVAGVLGWAVGMTDSVMGGVGVEEW